MKVIRTSTTNMTIIAILNMVYCVVSGCCCYLYPLFRLLRPWMSSQEKLSDMKGKKPKPKEMPPPPPMLLAPAPVSPPKSEWVNEENDWFWAKKFVFGSGAER